MPQGPFSAKDQLEIASLGTELALLEIIGVAVGYWLDRKLGTLPWCMVGGVLVGFALGLAQIISAAKQAKNNLPKAKKDGRS